MNGKTGKLYGVSVGPGDPELMTLAAVRTIRSCDCLAAPDLGTGKRTALEIVKGALGEEGLAGIELVDCSTPMTRDKAQTAAAYDAIADRLSSLLDAGKDVAFVTLGDAGVYSTYYYVHERMVARGYDCEVIPGVTSFTAAAARLGEPLCEGAEQLLVVPVAAGDPEGALGVEGTKVFMKSGKHLSELQEMLAKQGVDASMVAYCGMPNEVVARDFQEVEDSAGYMAVVIAKGSGSHSGAQASSSFFQNRACAHFPCHEGIDPARFNCMFCYCPLYALGDACGGTCRFTASGVKDCTACTVMHDGDAGVQIVKERFVEICAKAGRRPEA